MPFVPSPINNGLLFIVNTLFNLYLIILVVRLILVWVKSDYFNPITQFTTKLTNFLVIPLRRLIPNVGRIEVATLIIIFLIELLKFFLVSLILFGMPNIIGLLILAIADIFNLIIQIFFFAIILYVILSWIQPYSPVTRVLYQFTLPIIRPFQRFIRPISGIDITPIFALIFLQLLNIVLVGPILEWGWSIASG